MGSFYLSKHNNKKDNSIRLYAVSQIWDAEKGKQKKDQQIYLGCKHKDGSFNFNSNAETYLYLLRDTEFERPFYHWQDYKKEQQVFSSKESKDSKQSQETPDEQVKKVDAATVLDAGTDLLLSNVSEVCGLTDTLTKIFGQEIADLLLSLAFYCVANPRAPLYAATSWAPTQKLPGLDSEANIKLTCDKISKTMEQLSEGSMLQFLKTWLKRFPPNNRLSLDITSISSYSRNCPEVTYGYNRDHESLPQINLLMMVDQDSKLPVWFEKLPGAISDVSTIKDTVHLLQQLDDSPRAIVCDRGFASKDNVKCLLEHHFKFTMGIPLFRFSAVRDEIKKAVEANEFHNPGITIELYENSGTRNSEVITKIVNWEGHRIYLHIYYCDDYRTSNHNELMHHINVITDMLKNEHDVKNDFDKYLVNKCFTVKKTPVRGIKVTCDSSKVKEVEKEYGGFFVIASNQIKDPQEALNIYKLRDGVEKRFDDLKNEEDCHRLRMHSSQRVSARLFIQFIAQILRCWLLNERQKNNAQWKALKLGNMTVNDIMRTMASLKYIHMQGHHSFYKRPTKDQIALMNFFNISTENRLSWPSLN